MKREKTKLFTIGVVASMFNIHPQTLRLYEKEGLIKPTRSRGRTRYYTEEDIERLEFILTLSRDLGVNLAGIDIILRMKEHMEELEAQFQKLVEFIQKEISEAYQRDESIKSIVLTERKDLFKVLKNR
ncbi:MAG: helix-turn-helix transcriptional regulator [Aquificaceae bacterium]|nr:helix-turn-helix transcriptional regulator [Aquificaceae bacterium]MCX7990056.1 helix-turn-helix transcriptional regulator [Aquificaceae bacterium]MDW8032206.1 helix-turn-helix transcriptional regulator [Aquificaceae bacterium]MDW8294179.1 helix-turn-helix transcriptional regulator [Aquificaceae bacterium]